MHMYRKLLWLGQPGGGFRIQHLFGDLWRFQAKGRD